MFRHPVAGALSVIARRALAADDDSLQAWARLRLVSRAFRSAIAGDCARLGPCCVAIVLCRCAEAPFIVHVLWLCLPGPLCRLSCERSWRRLYSGSRATWQSLTYHDLEFRAARPQWNSSWSYCHPEMLLCSLEMLSACQACPWWHHSPAALTEEQRSWLSTTSLRLRKVIFTRDDTASAALLQKVRCSPTILPCSPHCIIIPAQYCGVVCSMGTTGISPQLNLR